MMRTSLHTSRHTLNQRYWFTTWRCGRIAAGLMLIGLVLKLATANERGHPKFSGILQAKAM